MGADEEGVPMFFQQSAGQSTQFFIATPIGVRGDIGIGGDGSHDIHHIQLIDPSLRG